VATSEIAAISISISLDKRKLKSGLVEFRRDALDAAKQISQQFSEALSSGTKQAVKELGAELTRVSKIGKNVGVALDRDLSRGIASATRGARDLGLALEKTGYAGRKAGDQFAKGYAQGLQSTKVQAAKVGQEAGTSFSRAAGGQRSILQGVGQGFGQTLVLGAVQAVQSGAGTIASGLGGIVTQAFQAGTARDQIRATVEALTKDVGLTKQLLQDMSDFAEKTPFNLPQVREGGKVLLAMGVQAKDLIPTMQELGNAAAATGTPFNELAAIYGKMRVQGRAYQEDINQFSGRGIPVAEELQKRWGATSEEFRKMTEDGEIGFEAIRSALQAMSAEGGRYHGLLDKMANETGGKFSNLQDQITGIWENTFTAMKPAIDGAINFGSEFASSIEQNEELFGALNQVSLEFTSYLEQNPGLAKELADVIAGIAIEALTELARLGREFLDYLKQNPEVIRTAAYIVGDLAKGMAQVAKFSSDIFGWVTKFAQGLTRAHEIATQIGIAMREIALNPLQGIPKALQGGFNPAEGGGGGQSGGVTFAIPGKSVNEKISSPYGPRWGRLHAGNDYSYPEGTPVQASITGKVIEVAKDKGEYFLGIEGVVDGKKVKIRLGHLDSINVGKGQQVLTGQRVGTVGGDRMPGGGKGSWGSTGAHLHYETYINGKSMDPRKFHSIMGGAQGMKGGSGAPPRATAADGGSPYTITRFPGGAKGGGGGFNAAQLGHAKTIAQVGRGMGMSDRDIKIAFATALQESGLRNLAHGDRDSQGLFQQRPSMGWKNVTDPKTAAESFFRELAKVKNRGSLSVAQAAQKVQRSAYPDAYAKWEDEASTILSQIGGGGGAAAGGGGDSALDTQMRAKLAKQRAASAKAAKEKAERERQRAVDEARRLHDAALRQSRKNQDAQIEADQKQYLATLKGNLASITDPNLKASGQINLEKKTRQFSGINERRDLNQELKDLQIAQSRKIQDKVKGGVDYAAAIKATQKLIAESRALEQQELKNIATGKAAEDAEENRALARERRVKERERAFEAEENQIKKTIAELEADPTRVSDVRRETLELQLERKRIAHESALEMDELKNTLEDLVRLRTQKIASGITGGVDYTAEINAVQAQIAAETKKAADKTSIVNTRELGVFAEENFKLAESIKETSEALRGLQEQFGNNTPEQQHQQEIRAIAESYSRYREEIDQLIEREKALQAAEGATVDNEQRMLELQLRRTQSTKDEAAAVRLLNEERARSRQTELRDLAGQVLQQRQSVNLMRIEALEATGNANDAKQAGLLRLADQTTNFLAEYARAEQDIKQQIADINSRIADSPTDNTLKDQKVLLEEMARINLDGLKVSLEGVNTQYQDLVDVNRRVSKDIRQMAGEELKGFFSSVISGAESIGDAFGNLFDNLLTRIADLGVNLLFENLFGGIMNPSGGGGGGLGGFLDIGKSLLGLVGFAKGGVIPGRGNRDSELIRAMPGEGVLTKNAMKHLGTGGLSLLNNLPKYAKGGMVGNNIVPLPSRVMPNAPQARSDGPAKVEVSYKATEIAGQRYLTEEQFQRLAPQLVQAGADRALGRLQNSTSARRSVGL